MWTRHVGMSYDRAHDPQLDCQEQDLYLPNHALLYQLIKLINCTQTKNPEILEKNHEKSHTYFGFNFNVTRIYLSTYTYECTGCPIALNVDFFRYSSIIIIVLKLNPCRSEIILFVIRNPNNAL